jgi:hypothetical protein
MSKNPFLQTHFADLERGVKSKYCETILKAKAQEKRQENCLMTKLGKFTE